MEAWSRQSYGPARAPPARGDTGILPGVAAASYLGPVTPKIVLNGKEYDGVESMPPDVRKDYEAVLESLQATGGDEVLSLLRSGEHTNIKASFREIVVNGKSYGSVDEMPADVRRTYEEAVARMGGGGGGGGGGEIGSRPPRPSRPLSQPPIPDEHAGKKERRGGSWLGAIVRALFWMAVGAAITVWVLRHPQLVGRFFPHLL
jgi:hypothetical protein